MGSKSNAQGNNHTHPNKNNTLIIQPKGPILPKSATSDTVPARAKKSPTQNTKKITADTLNKKGKKPIQKGKPLAPRIPPQPGSTLIYKQN